MCIILNYARHVQRVMVVCLCVCVCVYYQILSKLEVLAPKGGTPTF